MNVIIKRHEYILQNNIVLKELFPTNLFFVTNKRTKDFRDLVARADLYNMKTDLSDQTDHVYKKCGRKFDFYNKFLLEKTSSVCFANGIKFKISRNSTCNSKNFMHLVYCKKRNKQGVGSCIK